MKRLLSAILCMAMLLGTLAVPALAAPEKTVIEPIQKKAQPAFSWNSIPASNAGDGSTSANAIELASGVPYDKTWNSSNDDQNCFFTFTTTEKGVVSLNVSKSADSEGNFCNFDLFIFDAEGGITWQANTQSQANNTEHSFQFEVGLKSGTYFLCLTPGFQVKSGSVVTQVSYTFTKNDYFEVEPNNNIYQATPIALNRFYDGVYGEQSTLAEYADWFSVKLAAGSTYKICLKGFGDLDDTDTKIALVKPDESKIALKDELRKNVESGYNYYEYKATEGGKHYIRIYNYGGQTGIPYSVGVYGNPPVAEAPEITSHPKSITVNVGAKASFSVTATGASAYQWQYSDDGINWVNCVSTGFNTRTFSFTTVMAFNNRQYRCRVSNSGGTVYSKAAKLTVNNAKPVITSQPESQVVTAGQTARFSVTATNAGSYRWQYSDDGTTWYNSRSSGYNTANYSFTAISAYNGRKYRCVVSNSVDETVSSVATLMVKPNAPVITTQPKSITVVAGAKAEFKIVATNVGTYQWQYSRDGGKTWVNSGSTGYNTANYSFTAIPAYNGRMYRCKLSKGSEVVISKTVTLSVNSAYPVITAQPQKLEVIEGTTAEFSITAENVASYQWQWSDDGTTWYNSGSTGYNSAKYSFTAISAYNGRMYRCVVKNAVGTVYSESVKLTVKPVIPAPVIKTQPANQTVTVGGTARFSVTADNATAYLWQYSADNGTNWVDCTGVGSNTATYTFVAAASDNGRQYKCRVSNGAHVVFSSAATLTVKTAGPTITSQPKSITVDMGATASFTVGATNATSYQWQYSRDGGTTWVNCASAGNNTATFSFSAPMAYNGWKYRCRVSNDSGVVYSAVATLTVKSTLPTITAQPADVIVAAGGRAAFTVSASNATSYQWERSVDGGTTWENCTSTGNNTPTFSFTAAASHNGWYYRCKVSNNSGTVISSVAHLSVTP